MSISMPTIPSIANGGVLCGNDITAQLKMGAKRDSLAAKFDDVTLNVTPHFTNMFSVDVFDKAGNAQSNLTFDNSGRIIQLITNTKDGKRLSFFPEDCTIDYNA